jgi:hypothetical protein
MVFVSIGCDDNAKSMSGEGVKNENPSRPQPGSSGTAGAGTVAPDATAADTAKSSTAAADMPVAMGARSLDTDGLKMAWKAQRRMLVWGRAQEEGDLKTYLAQFHEDATIQVQSRPGNRRAPKAIKEVAGAQLAELAHRSDAPVGPLLMTPLPGALGMKLTTKMSFQERQYRRRLDFDLELNADSELLLRRQVSHPGYPMVDSAKHSATLQLDSGLVQAALVRGPCLANQREGFPPGWCEREGAMLVLFTNRQQAYVDLLAPAGSNTWDVYEEFPFSKAGVIWEAHAHSSDYNYQFVAKGGRLTIILRTFDNESGDEITVDPLAVIEPVAAEPLPFYCATYEDPTLRRCLPNAHAIGVGPFEPGK